MRGKASRGVVTLQYKIAVGMNEPKLRVSRWINPQKQQVKVKDVKTCRLAHLLKI